MSYRRLYARVLAIMQDERGWIAGAITIASAIASAYAQYETSQQNARVMEYQGKVARNQGEAAKQAAAIAADNQANEDRQIMAAQRARIGQAGVLGDIGSTLLAQMEAAETAALNEARIRWSGDTTAAGHFAEEIGMRYQAKGARRLGYLNAGTTLLSGAASAYGAYKGGGNPYASNNQQIRRNRPAYD